MDNLVFTVLEIADYSVKCIITLITVIYVNPWLIIIAVISLCYLFQIRKSCL